MNDESYQAALGLALRKIHTKERFEAEVRRFLADFPDDTVERVIEFLKGRRIICDSRTTQNLIERSSGKRAVGIGKIRTELIERGAPEETVESVLNGHEFDEQAQMLQLLEKKYSPTDSRPKAARFLFSRGFSEEEIESVLDRFFHS